MGLLKSTMISAGKWFASYFVMNKLIFYILTTTTFVFANCPDYTAAMKTVEKHLSHKSTHDLELNVSCNEKSLIYANFKIVLKQDNQLIPLSFELYETFIKEQGLVSAKGKHYKLDLISQNPLLHMVALINGSEINNIKKTVRSAFSLMLKVPMPISEPMATSVSQIKTIKGHTKNYDYFLLTDPSSSTSRISFNPSSGQSRKKSSSAYSLKGALHQKDLDFFNQDLKELLLYFRKDLDEELTRQIDNAAQELIESTKDEELKVLEFINFEHNIFDATPGIDLVRPNTVELAYPAGDSRLFLKVKFRVRAQTKHIRKTTNVTITVKDFKISDLIHVSPQADGHVEVVIPEQVKVMAKVDVDFSNDVLNLIMSVIEKTFDPFSKRLRELVGETLKEELKADLEKGVHASKNPFGKEMTIPSPISEKIGNREQIIQKIEDKIFQHHLADSTLQNPVFRSEDQLAWKDYAHLDLDAIEYDRATIGMDGAIWTGTLLTSMALKYSVTQSGNDLKRIQLLIDKLNIIATVNGAGPLARSAIPESSRWYRQLEEEGRLQTFRSKLIDGEYWHSFQGYQGVSRDQYMGVMTGLINTYMHVDDPYTKQKAKNVFKHLLDYLIDTNWIVYEDHPGNLFDEDEPRTLPAHYAGIGLHKLTYLLAGTIMFPENKTYKDQYTRYLPLAKMVWFIDFISSLEPLDEYYNYNLKHTLYLTLSNILKDEKLTKHFSKGVKIFEHYIGHHKNPYFSAIRLVVAKNFGIELDFFKMAQEIEENYNGAFYRAHNMGKATEHEKELAKRYSDELITTYTLSGDERLKVPAAIPPRFRNYTLDFLWQRDPFTPLNINAPIKRGNIAGLDMHIMYWLLKSKNIQ